METVFRIYRSPGVRKSQMIILQYTITSKKHLIQGRSQV